VPTLLNRATPDGLFERGPVRAVTYAIDLSATTRETAPLLVSHTYGRVGAVYAQFPSHAHYLNVYVGTGLTDDIRTLLFPELTGAGRSMSLQNTPPRPFERRHGVLKAMNPSQAETLLAASPVAIEMFEIGPNDRPVEMYGVSLAMGAVAAFESCVASTGFPLVWLTPPVTTQNSGSRA
jgi:hypothetical protein